MSDQTRTAVMEVQGVHWASSKAVAEATLSRRPGVLNVEANPVAQTATVTFDPGQTSDADLAGWVRDCGYHCAGKSVPGHLCDPMNDGAPGDHAGHGTPAVRDVQEVMGHGGHGGHGMSMESMVRDMRNRFLLAASLSVPIALWSPIGREVLGFTVPAPFGLRDDVFALILSLPVIFYSAWIFFDGAWRAVPARTPEMMGLVAEAAGCRRLYILAITLTGGRGGFYEVASGLTAFVPVA